MTRPRPRISPTLWSTVSIVAAILLALLTAGKSAAPASAQAEPTVTWEQTGLTGSAVRLFTPTSGALFARSANTLMRSNDAGTTWAQVTMPEVPPPLYKPPGTLGTVYVDPSNHANIYLAAGDGLYKTGDDAQTWSMILPFTEELPNFRGLAISPADSNVLYVAMTGDNQHRLVILRSPNGGATWENVFQSEASPHVSGTWYVPLLLAHPTDPNHVYLGSGFPRTGIVSDIEESVDGGHTWTMVYHAGLAAPKSLIVGGDKMPGRLVVGLNKDDRGGGSLVIRSDDNGTSWKTTREYTGGGGVSGGGPNVTIVSLTADPTNLDRMLLVLYSSQGAWTSPPPFHASTDGGMHWTEVRLPDVGIIYDAVYGIDGRMMFIATSTGVWRATAP